MTKEFVVALIGAGAALLAATLSYFGPQRVAAMNARAESDRRTEDRALQAEATLARFRDPMLRSAYDLQSRLYNMLSTSLMDRFYVAGTEDERQYVLHNTAFVIAQYFAWTEIVRRDAQFLDMGELERTRTLSMLQDDITALWQTDSMPPAFRLFAGEQRALGERMIRLDGAAKECIGYADFLDLMQETPTALPFAARLVRDAEDFGRGYRSSTERLTSIQHSLIDLLAFFDPEYVRYTKERRTKVGGMPTGGAAPSLAANDVRYVAGDA